MTFTQADGITVLANASVAVFYMQPSDSDLPEGTTINLAELASGTTNASGVIGAVLDTSAVAPSDLGDAGDGTPDAFNAMVAVQDQEGNQAIVDEIVTVNSSFSAGASVNLESSPAQAARAVQFPTTAVTGPHRYRYTPVLPLNSGDGMQAVLHYTTSSSTAKQTKIESTILSTAPGGGGWGVGQFQLEEKNRSIVAPYRKNNSFHHWIWARYKYVEYFYRLDHEWKANHFTGDLTDANPDCCLKDTVINVVKYTVPAFTPGPNGAYWFRLTPNNSGWTRSSGTRKENSADATFYEPFGGSVHISSITTYASITSVTYNYRRGCPSGHSRVIWGHGTDPGEVPRVQANCFDNGIL